MVIRFVRDRYVLANRQDVVKQKISKKIKKSDLINTILMAAICK